uniref:hypothetical protein n=1 Tax=Pedobacter schmidteae TaxID=2201271 RepID=UPI000EB1EB28|nr:hypothetical protein [Pedobacter schmidteae]
MKKLFFAAALAIVAVGSALSVNAIQVYTVDPDGTSGPGAGTLIDCTKTAISCESLQGSVYYQQNAPQTLVDPADLEDTFRN